MLFASALVILEDELTAYQRDVQPTASGLYLNCFYYMEEAKTLAYTGRHYDEEKTYLIAMALKMWLLIKTQCEPGMIFQNENDKIEKVLLLQKIEKLTINKMVQTKLLLKPLEGNVVPAEMKRNLYIVTEFAYKCQAKDSIFHRFKGKEIQSALTMMIAEDGHANNVYDAKKKELTEEAKDSLLHKMTSKSLTPQDMKGIEKMAKDARQEISVPFQYIMENMACKNIVDEKEHLKKKATHMLVAAMSKQAVPETEPILQTLSALELATDPNLLCIVAAITIIQPDYPRKPFPKDVNSNKRRHVASLLLRENCDMVKYYSSNENLPRVRVDESPPAPYQSSGGGRAEVIIEGQQRGGQGYQQRGGSFRGFYGKRPRNDGPGGNEY